MKKLAELTTAEFVDLLASDAPAPGGGSAAALEGALGCRPVRHGLRSDHRGQEQGEVRRLSGVRHREPEEADRAEGRFRGRDGSGHRGFQCRQRRLWHAKATDEEKAARSAAIQEGLKGCTKTPMEMMELIDETLTLAQSLLGRFNDTSASDLGVAFLSLKAGIQGAWLNVLINVGSLKDQEFAAEYRAKGEALLAHALPLADECYAEIVKLIEG